MKAVAQALPVEQWQRLSCGFGTKGERIYDWARIAVNCSHESGMKRWILLRRNIDKPDDPLSLTYHQGYALADTTLEALVFVAGQRWRIEECFAIAKDKLGLSQYEVRSWQGWHRHMTLVMAAQAFSTVLRHQLEPISVPKKSFQDNGPQQYGCVQSSARIIVPLSIAELLKWVWKLLFPLAWSIAQVLHWSIWRRGHQATARFFHYKKRSSLSFN